MRFFNNQKGMTLAELSIAIAAGSILMVSVLLFLSKAQQGIVTVENQGDLLLMGERGCQNLVKDINASYQFFTAASNCLTCTGTLLNAVYQTITGTSGAPVPVSWSKLPIFPSDPTTLISNTITADAALWGNCLFFAATAPSVSFTVISSTTPQVNDWMSIDIVQFVFIYLAQMKDKAVPGTGGRLALVEWRSTPLVNIRSLNPFTGMKLTNTASTLSSSPYLFNFAWDPGASPATTAFYQIKPSNNPVLVPLGSIPLSTRSWAELPTQIVPQDYKPRGSYLGLRNNGGSLSGTTLRSTYSIAYNTTTITTQATNRVKALHGPAGSIFVPTAANADTAGFPGGFEVMVTGEPGGRELFANIILMAASSANTRFNTGEFMAVQSSCFANFKDNY